MATSITGAGPRADANGATERLTTTRSQQQGLETTGPDGSLVLFSAAGQQQTARSSPSIRHRRRACSGIDAMTSSTGTNASTFRHSAAFRTVMTQPASLPSLVLSRVQPVTLETKVPAPATRGGRPLRSVPQFSQGLKGADVWKSLSEETVTGRGAIWYFRAWATAHCTSPAL